MKPVALFAHKEVKYVILPVSYLGILHKQTVEDWWNFLHSCYLCSLLHVKLKW